jgi:hypothetical protein
MTTQYSEEELAGSLKAFLKYQWEKQFNQRTQEDIINRDYLPYEKYDWSTMEYDAFDKLHATNEHWIMWKAKMTDKWEACDCNAP